MPSDRPAEERPAYSQVAKRAALWLLFLAPFFYLTYGTANWLASLRDDVGSIVYLWEFYIPFIAWTIVPYWSINLFYAGSLFFNDTPQGVNRLAGRYLTAQVVAVACFIAFPLSASFVRPETTGIPGFMFAVLGGFDKPFNQAPSLHIALTLIIWDHLRGRLPLPLRWIWHIWCFIIAASVLTTWQHHFIDIPTGALLGFFALWLFPRDGELPFAGFRLTGDPKARRLAGYYGLGAAVCLAGAVVSFSSTVGALILLWPAIALAIVSFGYAGAGPKIFQKAVDGSQSFASRWLLLPYRIGARLNAWAWTRKLPASVPVGGGVFLGRTPSRAESAEFASVVDLTAEFPGPRRAGCRWLSVPMIDLLSPAETDLDRAAGLIEAARQAGPVLVCCALGFQRSAGAVARWMIDTGRAPDRATVAALLAKAGRPVHLHDADGHA